MRSLRWLTVTIVVLLAACSTPVEPTGPTIPDVSGTWSATTSLSACTATPAELLLSLEQSGGELSGYLKLSVVIGASTFDILARVMGSVSEADKVTATVTFPTGILSQGDSTAKLTLVDDGLIGSLSSDSLQYCGESPPTTMTMLIDVPRTSPDFTAPPPVPNIAGDWVDLTSEVSECGVVSPVEVSVHLEQDEYGFVYGQAHVSTTADLPTYTLLEGYILTNGEGTLTFNISSDMYGNAFLNLLDTGVLEARFQYNPFYCSGAQHTFYFEAQLEKQAP